VFAFAAIFLIMTVAQGITEEREQKLLKRIFLTPTTSAELMTAESLANMAAATLQTCFIMLAAFLIGYRPHTDLAGIVMAFVLMLVFSFCCVGFGLIVGAISKNSGAATGFSFVFILPLMFLGTFVSIGEPTIANKMMPSWYVSETIKSLFLRGAAWNSSIILTNLGIIALFSIVVFLLGIIAFQKFGKK
jgi:ABC-2 type transport system permease protein